MLRYSLVALLAIGFTGCSSKEYYNQVSKSNAEYLKSYDKAESGKVVFKGKFDGEIEIVEAKKLPQIQQIQKPKEVADYVMQGLSILAPVSLGIAGYHYNYKTTDSNNKYNAQSLESYTSNFDNTNVSTSVTDTSTSVTDTSVTDTSTSITDTSTSVTDTTGIADFTTDGSTTTVGQ